MGRKRKIKDLEGQTVMSFDQPCHLPCESGEVKCRGLQIPKQSGGMRQLGIPTVKDRIVQQAVAQVLSPLYERVFSELSFGFRPNRSAHQALKQGSAYVEGGYSTVVDLDLEKFFDKVNHTRLMARLARDMKEVRLLRLILKFLKAGLMQDGVCRKREEGTPQGGPSRFERGKSG